MTNKHTPAPWHYSGEDGKPIVGHNNKRVCDMDCRDGRINKADATLITAAPFMLSTLESLLEDCKMALDGRWNGGAEGFEYMQDLIETTLKKAKG